MDGNILRRETDGFLCKIPVTGAYVHVFKKGQGERRLCVREPKLPRAGAPGAGPGSTQPLCTP